LTLIWERLRTAPLRAVSPRLANGHWSPPEYCQQKNDWERYSEKPKQCASTERHNKLLFRFLEMNRFAAQMFPDPSGGTLFETVAPSKMIRPAYIGAGRRRLSTE